MQDLTTRIEMLELLIQAFSPPGESLAREISEWEFSNRIAACCEHSTACCFPRDLIKRVRKLPEEFLEQDAAEILTLLEVEYLRLFVTDFPIVRVQPCESWYQEGRMMGKAAQECRALYRESGLETVQGGPLPDHLVTQLEYLLFLALLEEKGLSGGDQVLCETARTRGEHFYESHIMTWVPLFCAGVQSNSRVSFYRVMARLLKNSVVLGNRDLHLHRLSFDEGVSHGCKIA